MKRDFNPDGSTFKGRIEKRLTYTAIVKELDFPRPDDVVIMGTYSRSWRNIKRREVRKDRTAKIGDYTDSITTFARDYLTECYGRRPVRKADQDGLKSWSMPLYAYPCMLKDGCYVDIKSAWYSILSIVGWNVEFLPGRRMGIGQPPDDFPFPTDKVARSSLVTAGITNLLPVWKDGKITNTWIYNRLENRQLFACIAYVLHSLAVTAVTDFSCKYVATDGFILPESKARGFIQVIEDFGLSASIRARGFSVIGGAGAYIVGNNKTKNPLSYRAVDLLRRDADISWIGPRMAIANQKRSNL